MKTLSAGHLASLAARRTRLAWAATFTRPDGQVFRFCTGTRNKTVESNEYTANPGFVVSSITCTAGASVVDTFELQVVPSSAFEKLDFLTGRWNGTRVEFNQFDWAVPADGFIPWPVYRLADTQPKDGGFQLEMRDLRMLWRQDYTLYTGKECQNRLGDARCQVVLGPYTHAAAVTSVSSARRVFTCSGLTQPADYFTNGIFIPDAGAHAGLELLILDHATGGVITLAEPLVEDIVVTDTGDFIAGCLKRREDCIAFSNILNMRAPGLDAPTLEQAVGS